MRITHYLAHFRLSEGGVVRAVLDFCEVLARRGHDVRVLTRDEADAPPEWRDAAAGRPHLVPLVGRSWEAASRVLGDSDVLHLHTPWDPRNLRFARQARRCGLPYVLTVHGMLDDWSMAQRPLKKRLYLAVAGRRLLEGAAAVHCTASGELEQASRWFPNGNGCVAPYIFDLSPFRELPGPEMARRSVGALSGDVPTVLFLSRLHYKKQPEVLIDAAALLRDEGRKFRVLFAGTGEAEYEAALLARVRDHRLEGVVHFLGLVLGEQKVSLYEAADVFSLPTSQENFGFVLAEALAASTPVVTTKGTDIWRELESSGGALLTEGNPAATARGIATLLDDPDRARTMGRLGRQWVLRELDPDAVGGMFESIYETARSTADPATR